MVILDEQDTRRNTESMAETATLAMTLNGPWAEKIVDPLHDVIMSDVTSRKVLD